MRTWKRCIHCGNVIPSERIKAMPDTTTCVKHSNVVALTTTTLATAAIHRASDEESGKRSVGVSATWTTRRS